VERDVVADENRRDLGEFLTGGWLHNVDRLKSESDDHQRQNRIMISGPKADGTYVIEFKTAAGEALAISVPRNETAVLKHFQERMPYGLFMPEVA
jgi:hypothetical protein